MARTKSKSRPLSSITLTPRLFAWAVAFSYAVILVVLFREFIFTDLILYGSDTLQSGFYNKGLHAQALRAGELIEWIPTLYGGMPYVDAIHSDIFYVPTWPIYTLLPLHRALGWALILHFWLAGVGMYLAARYGWTLDRLPAAFAGLSYMLAPYLISMTLPGHDGRIFVVAWFPIGFLLLKRIWDQERLRDMGLLAIVIGLIILTPHVQMAYYSLWAYCAYSIYRIVIHLREHRRLPWTASLGALGAVFVALGISAIQFYPSLEYVSNHSPRSGDGLSIEMASSWSLHPEEIVNLVVPEFSGINNLSESTYWGRSRIKDRLETGGVVALWLALIGAFATRSRDRWFFFGLGIFAVLYGLGAHTPVFKLFYYLVPKVGFTRAPARIMFLYVFAISLGAGMCLNTIFQKRSRRDIQSLRWTWYLCGILAAIATAWSLAPDSVIWAYKSLFYSDISPGQDSLLNIRMAHIPRAFWLALFFCASITALLTLPPRRATPWAFAAIALLAIADTVRIDRLFIQPVDVRNYFPRYPVVDYLQSQDPPFRVFDAATYVTGLSVPDWVERRGFMTNYFALHGLSEVTGYHGNQLHTYNNFLGGSRHSRLRDRHHGRIYDLAAVKYIIFNRLPNRDGTVADSSLVRVYDRSTMRLYENSDMPAYARLVSCWELRAPEDSTYARLFEDEFNHLACVLVDSALPFISNADTASAGSAHITLYEPERVEIQVDASRDALLVLADNNYPAWHATVDNEDVPVVTTNGTFRGVVVPAGKHRVQFQYYSREFAVGMWLTFTALFLALFAVGYGWRNNPA